MPAESLDAPAACQLDRYGTALHGTLIPHLHVSLIICDSDYKNPFVCTPREQRCKRPAQQKQCGFLTGASTHRHRRLSTAVQLKHGSLTRSHGHCQRHLWTNTKVPHGSATGLFGLSAACFFSTLLTCGYMHPCHVPLLVIVEVLLFSVAFFCWCTFDMHFGLHALPECDSISVLILALVSHLPLLDPSWFPLFLLFLSLICNKKSLVVSKLHWDCP